MTMIRRVVGSAALAALACLLVAPAAPRAQSDMHEPLDKLLDMYVRDGNVYYRAVKSDRASLDRYVASLDVPRSRVDGWSREEQEAFWVNAYNAFVLRTVVDAYPIAGKSAQYPPKSIRQIPGAFEAIKHRVAGQSLTLDEIEKNVIAPFGDARLLLALGRGAVGSGRLASAAYQGASLEKQLKTIEEECALKTRCTRMDRDAKILEVTPIVSWREDTFVKTYAARGEQMWANRTPVERSVAVMIYPYLFQTEKEFLAANAWRMQYGTFDWRLNDLTGGPPQ